MRRANGAETRSRRLASRPASTGVNASRELPSASPADREYWRMSQGGYNVPTVRAAGSWRASLDLTPRGGTRGVIAVDGLVELV